MNIASPRVITGGGNQSASVSDFSRDLFDLGARYRQSSAAFDRALTAMRKNDASACGWALLDFRAELMKQISICQALENKLQFAMQDSWQDDGEVYR